jgi:hypothetical protein
MKGNQCRVIKNFPIPLPPPYVQQQIISECESIEGSVSEILNEGVSMTDLSKEIQRRKEDVFKKFL